MLGELSVLFDALPSDASRADYADAMVGENVLGKPTLAARRSVRQRLTELYSLDPSLPLFRVLRRLWDVDPPGRPLLAMLCALARDPLLRLTAPPVLGLAQGKTLERSAFLAHVREVAGLRFNDAVLAKVAANAIRSWQLSGHLSGRAGHRTRQTIRPTPGAVALVDRTSGRAGGASAAELPVGTGVGRSGQGYACMGGGGGQTGTDSRSGGGRRRGNRRHEAGRARAVSQVRDLAAVYKRNVSAPWPRTLAGAQRVMMIVYPKNRERALRAAVGEFEQATLGAGREWRLVDGALLDQEFRKVASARLESALKGAGEKTVVGLVGVASLYGFVRVSKLIHDVERSIEGRLAVFFPGSKDGNNYRLLDARDGWSTARRRRWLACSPASRRPTTEPGALP